MNTRSDLRAFLRTLETETLVGLLCEQAERDPGLRRRLSERQISGQDDPTAHGPAGAGLAEVSDLLDDAVDAADTARSIRVSSVLDTLERLLDAGTSADVAPLARRVVDTLLGARNGDGPGVDDLLPRAVRLYARACAAHPPPAETLAGWFTTVAFERPGWPDIDLSDFAEPLGEEGIRQVRSAVDRVLCERGIDATDPRLHTARRLRQEIAEACGDVDTAVWLLSERLPRVDVSLKIVRVLRAAGRHTEAIAHAAAALRHAGHEDGGRRGSMIEALERLRANQATEAPVDPVDPAGPEGTDGHQAGHGAVGQPEAKPVEVAESAKPTELTEPTEPAEPTESAEVVGVAEVVAGLLQQDRCEQAWKAAADGAPEDVLPHYRDHVERLIERRTASSYARAAAQLRRLRTLHGRADSRAEFTDYLGGLVREHHRKTRLLDEIRKARIALPRSARPRSR